MRISFGKHHTDLNWLPVLMFAVVVMLNQDLMATLIMGPPDPDKPPEEGYTKHLAAVAILLTFLRLNRLSPWLKNLFLVMHGILFLMVLESLYKYGHPMMYPHVFSKLFALYTLFACYAFYKDATPGAVRATIYLVALVFFLDLVIHYPTILSFAAFIEVDRGFSAYSTFFITLPLFHFLNRYLGERRFLYLLCFFAFCGFVLFLNHRSVWLATGFGMMINILYVFYKAKEPVPLPTVTPIIVLPVLFVVLVLSYVFSENPELVESIQARVEDISKADEQGTGKWRLQQFQSYLPYILDRPLIGNRFEGYELPNQFIHEGSGGTMFGDNTGHHFHSFYVDSLFYGGVVLLFLLMAPSIYLMVRAFRSPFKLRAETLAFVAFAAAGILYGTSYLLQYYYFGIVGIALAVLDDEEEALSAEAWQASQEEAESEPENAPADPQPRRGRPTRPLPA